MKVKFGKSYGILIKDINLKKNIMEYLFSNIELSKYRYRMLKDENNLEFLKKNQHYVSPNFKGINYLMIFIEINNKKHCILVDKRNLSYHKESINYYKLNLIKIKMTVNSMVFNGTIFDGKLIIDHNYFLIKDCYKMMGNSIESMEMSQKMDYLNSILKNNFNGKNYCDNFIFKLNKLYNYDDIELIKNRSLKNDENDIKIVGLEFFPRFSGINVVWLNKTKNKKIEISNKMDKNIDDNENTSLNKIGNSNKNIINFSYDLIHNLTKVLMERTYSYEKSENIKSFYLKKTNITDVYNVYKLSDKKRVGIAHIPNFKISRNCQEKVTDDYTLCDCVYYNKFKKWIPIKIYDN